MPLSFLGAVLADGKSAIPYYDKLKVIVPVLTGIGAFKYYFGGASNTWERGLQGKVILMTVCCYIYYQYN